MDPTTDFTIEYPCNGEELGLVLETMGAFVVVSQSSAQSEQYGVIPKDRFIQINEVSCEHKGPDEIVRLIQTYAPKGLIVTFRRSFPPGEMDDLNGLLTSPLQNDCIFFEDHFLLRLGHAQGQPFTDRAIRIVRITGPLLKYAKQFHLIPFGIALVWYNTSSINNIPYDSPPAGGQNLLPCIINAHKGDNGFFVLRFRCARDIFITSQEKERLLQLIDCLSHISIRDVTHLIRDISKVNEENRTSLVMQSTSPSSTETGGQTSLDFGEDSLQITNYSSTLNIPYPLNIMEYVQKLYLGELTLGLSGIRSNLKSLLSTGFHPEKILHSLTAVFIHCKQFVSPTLWDADVQKSVQDIIVEVAKHSAAYFRTSTVQPTGYFVYHCGDPEICDIYRPTRENFGNSRIYISKKGCRLFHQNYGGYSTWVLQKLNSTVAAYFIHSTDTIPPRFNWAQSGDTPLPAPIVQAICENM